MSGHNKWSSIKHKKGKEDAKRGKIFTKIIREITVAARSGGGDPEANPALRLAVSRAQNANMPKDNIERGIKRGTGELEGVNYEDFLYEAYSPGGVALIIVGLSDNKKRTVSEVRHAVTSHNGSMAEKGSVAWNFHQMGHIFIQKDKYDEDELMMTALDCGADDFVAEDDIYLITVNPHDLQKVIISLENENIKIDDFSLVYEPKNTVKANDSASQIIGLINELEDLDDVQNVFANFDIDDEILEKIAVE
ncbi:MAG: YebC/PmpR family DNA-binding transcriptional regulator [Candidatus Cloacimonadota bacterium]|nr:YebC/PmpR family DNA-binding transcriptional regulator [Candidatus Cloacimonadota bacterium]